LRKTIQPAATVTLKISAANPAYARLSGFDLIRATNPGERVWLRAVASSPEVQSSPTNVGHVIHPNEIFPLDSSLNWRWTLP
jgi:hypothetical protein